MQVKEAIILAGGLGTRLRDTVPGLPKCMAPVAGRPFLFYLINFLRSQGIERIIFSLGYKSQLIEDYLARDFATLDYASSIEEEPLGTGGAINLALSQAKDETVLIVNGDTLFKFNLDLLAKFHKEKQANITIALKPMKKFDRYGSVEMDSEAAITHFHEKKFCEVGNINGGVYLLETSFLKNIELPLRFSFETDLLEKIPKGIYGLVQDEYFIDIGIPEDYSRAQEELKRQPLLPDRIDNKWTLFIDRDGVINHEKKDDYILNWGEFRFYEGVSEALKELGKKFGKIIIISNQRGVGRGLMTQEDVYDIHRNMKKELEKAGARIDGIYFCTNADAKHPYRKPNPGMAFKAKKDFPGIDLERAIMVGNKPSDMLFGRYAGLYTVYVRTTNPEQEFPHPDIDLVCDSLSAFAQLLG